MKSKFLLMVIACFAISFKTFAQPQAQGEYHKYIVKKTDDERKKTKPKEWWGAGVIMFSKTDIPRTGGIKEVESQLTNSFSIDDKFVGRVYLPRSVNQMDPAKPGAITYRFYVDNSSTPYMVEAKGDMMPEGDWSSWLIDFPDNFTTAMNSIQSGKHTVRIEVWSSREVETTTIYTDENDKAVAYSKDNDNKGKFWASGEFTITR